MENQPTLKPGRNIALKVPPHQYLQTVDFYERVLGLTRLQAKDGGIGFEFGHMQLWIDSVATTSSSELWLELVSLDLEKASIYLDEHNVVRCDKIEPLPDYMKGFWIMSPSNTVHLVSGEAE